MAMAMTVPDFALKTSSLTTTTGRRPPCSWPRTGFRSAQTISPLNIRAMARHSNPLQPNLAQISGLASSTREPVFPGPSDRAYLEGPPARRGFGSESDDCELIRPIARAAADQG